MDGLAREIKEGMDDKKFVFLAVGVQQADMKVLKKISGSMNGQPVDPLRLKGLKFSEFFQWMSASMSVISSSAEGDRLALPAPSSWMEGFEV